MTELSREELLAKIERLELENDALKCKVRSQEDTAPPSAPHELINGLSLEEYRRYGRQMIVPQFGALESQLKLKKARVLVVGAGGLGCPALLYLSAAGVGHIGICDNDLVDESNLHRQVLHTTDSVGKFKCDSAKGYINKLNPNVDVTVYPFKLDTSNAFEIVEQYDVILDCTDAPSIRYLINDVAVLSGKTIVSGSGLKTDGQISVLNFNNIGPCYRCFYPTPPSPESVTTCSDGGVIGPIIGLVGVSMSVEAIKVLTGYYTTENFKPFLLSYTGYPQQQIRSFKMRNRQPACVVCGENPSLTKRIVSSGDIDYFEFCGKVDVQPLASKHRITVEKYREMTQGQKHILIDVRPKEQFAIAKLDGSINIQWDPTFRKLEDLKTNLPSDFDKLTDDIFVICRYGNDSQLATRKMLDELHFTRVYDIIGGLNKWSENVDPNFPQF